MGSHSEEAREAWLLPMGFPWDDGVKQSLIKGKVDSKKGLGEAKIRNGVSWRLSASHTGVELPSEG